MNPDTTPLTAESFVRAHRILFSPQEEMDLFLKFIAARAAEDERTAQKHLSRIVLNHTPIVRKTAKQYSGYGLDPNDLISEGLLGLTEAANRFKPELGIRFNTYAKSWVNGVILCYICQNYSLVNMFRSGARKKMFYSMRRHISQAMKEAQTEEVDDSVFEELAVRYGVDQNEVREMNEIMKSPYESLSEPVGEGQNNTRGDYLVDKTMDQRAQYELEELGQHQRDFLHSVMNNVLDDREKIIFTERELQDDTKTLEELGNDFHISRERVRQIQVLAKDKVYTRARMMAEYQLITPTAMLPD